MAGIVSLLPFVSLGNDSTRLCFETLHFHRVYGMLNLSEIDPPDLPYRYLPLPSAEVVKEVSKSIMRCCREITEPKLFFWQFVSIIRSSVVLNFLDSVK